jgi:transcriptional regulator GlxA family with amidase domain
MRKVAFIIPPSVVLLDLAGPVQVFREAIFYGFDLALEFYTYSDEVNSESGIAFGRIAHFREARLKEGDFLFMPGMDFGYISSIAFRSERTFFNWLAECAQKRVTVCSVCNGTFALGEAGLLKNTVCTTHFRRVKQLQKEFPDARVLEDTLFVKNNNIYSSAGVSAGIDLALAILEDLAGPLLTHKVARGLVVYHRRSDQHSQQSVYLDYRNHIHPKIHEVQDHLVDNISAENSIEELASLVSMSPRNLSRVFKEKTGLTVLEYLTQLRLEHAQTLLNNPHYTMDYVAAQCGFKSARQLQRILKEAGKKPALELAD